MPLINKPTPSSYPDKIIYNPDSENHTTTYDLNGNRRPISYTIHAKEYGTFPKPVAEHIQAQLAHKIVFKRGIKTNFEDEYKQVLEEISYHESD